MESIIDVKDFPDFETFVYGKKATKDALLIEIPLDDRTRAILMDIVKVIIETPDTGYESVQDYCMELYRKLSEKNLVYWKFE